MTSFESCMVAEFSIAYLHKGFSVELRQGDLRFIAVRRALLIAQGFDRVQLARSVGGEDAEDQPNRK